MLFCVIPSGHLRVTGDDRVAFVHGQVSNDVRGLKTPGFNHNVFLNVRGQVEFEARVYRHQQDLLLQTHPDQSAAIKERLRRYIVFDDVQLEDTSAAWRVYHVWGEDAPAHLQRLGHWGDVTELHTSFGEATIAASNRGPQPGFDLRVGATQTDALEAWLAQHGRPSSALTQERILAGISDAHHDGFAGFLPQECGLGHAINYKKGCYLGQEIMARLEARGQTQRHLVRVCGTHPMQRGDVVHVGQKAVGQIGETVLHNSEHKALAVLRKDTPADAVTINGNPIGLEVVG